MRSVLRHVLALVVTTALAVAHTWPLVPLRRSHLLGGDREDPWLNAWHLDWMRSSILGGTSPFEAPRLHWPLGAELYWHAQAPSKSIFGLVLPWMGIVEAANLTIFWTFILSGMTAWWLLRDVLRRAGKTGAVADIAAFAGACAFDFSRYHLCQAHAHMNLAAIEGIPLFVLFAFRYLETRKMPWLAGAGITALYVAWCDLYYVYYLALFVLFWLVATWWRRGPLFSRATLADPNVVPAMHLGVVSALCCLPAILPLLAHLRPAPYSIHGSSSYPADPLMLLVPDVSSRWSSLLPNPVAIAFRKLQNGILNDEEGGLFLGVAAPLLAAIAIREERAAVRPWGEVGLVFAVLSLGGYLNLGGIDMLPAQIVAVLVAIGLSLDRRIRTSARGREVIAIVVAVALLTIAFGMGTGSEAAAVRIPLPYLFFKHIAPFFGRGGMPVRFLLMTQLCLAALVALGTVCVAERIGRRWMGWALPSAALAVALVNLEMANKPFRMTKVERPPAIFEVIRDDPEDIAVFTDHVLGQFEQLYHRRPISFARQSRVPLRELALVESPLHRALVAFDLDAVNTAAAEEMRRFLVEHRFKYFVGHRRACREAIAWLHVLPDSEARRTRFLTEALGGRVVFEDESLEVVRFW